MSAAESNRDSSSNQESRSKTQGIYQEFCWTSLDYILNPVQSIQLNILITKILDNNY